MAKKRKEIRKAKKAARLQAEGHLVEETVPSGPPETTQALVRFFNHIAEKGLYAIILWVPLAYFVETYWLFDIPRVTVLRILTVVVLGAFLAGIAAAREWRFVRPPWWVWGAMALYFLIYVLSTGFSISPELSMHGGEGRNFGLFSLMNLLVLFFLIPNVFTQQWQLVRVLKLVVLSALMVALLGIYQFYHIIDESHFYVIVGLSWAATAGALALLGKKFQANSSEIPRYGALAAGLLGTAVLLTMDAATGHEILYMHQEDSGSFVVTAKLASGFHVFSRMLTPGRTNSTFGNPDFLISFLAIAIPVAFGFVLRRKWVYWIPLMICLFCIVLAMPPILGQVKMEVYWKDFLLLLAGLVVLAAFACMPTRSLVLSRDETGQPVNTIPVRYVPHVLLGIALTLAVFMYGLNVAGIYDKVDRFMDRHILAKESDRGQHMTFAWKSVKDYPILGSGPNTYRNTFMMYETLEYAQDKPDRREDKVHNSFVEAVATTGWLGAITYGMMLVAVLAFVSRLLVRQGRRLAVMLVITVAAAAILYAVQAAWAAGPDGVYKVLWVLAFLAGAWTLALTIRAHREDHRFLTVLSLFGAGVLYIAQSLGIFHTVVPYAFFWILMGVGVCLNTDPERLPAPRPWNISRYFSTFLVVALVVLIGLGSLHAAKPLAANHYYYEARQTEGREGYTKALPLYRHTLKWNPSEVRYLWSNAGAHLYAVNETGDRDTKILHCQECVRLISKAIDQEPKSGMLYLNRAQFRYSCRQLLEAGGETEVLEAALADANRTVELYPNGYTGYSFRAQILTDLGRTSAAIADDEMLFTIVPDYNAVSSKIRMARSDYVYNMLRLSDNYRTLGEEYAESGRPSQAEEQYQKADEWLKRANEFVTTSPFPTDNDTPRYLQQTVAVATRYLNQSTRDSEAGQNELALHHYEQGLAVLGKAKAIVMEWQPPQGMQESQYVPPMTQVGSHYMSLANQQSQAGGTETASELYRRAVDVFNTILELSPGDIGVRHSLATAYDRLGLAEEATEQYQQIVSMLQQYIEESPNEAQAYYLLGQGYESLGQVTEAIDAYEQTLKLDPGMEEANQALERLRGR